MTLAEFRSATKRLNGDTPLHIMDSGGACNPAALVSLTDLHPDDPATDSIDPCAVTLAAEAD